MWHIFIFIVTDFLILFYLQLWLIV